MSKSDDQLVVPYSHFAQLDRRIQLAQGALREAELGLNRQETYTAGEVAALVLGVLAVLHGAGEEVLRS